MQNTDRYRKHQQHHIVLAEVAILQHKKMKKDLQPQQKSG
jgi:hypothetical protein